MRYWLLSLFYLISLSVKAQTTAPKPQAESTPYLDDNYEKAIVYLKDQTSRVELRYNIYGDVMEFRGVDAVQSIGPHKLVLKVVLGKYTFVTDQYLLNGEPTRGFFVQLDSGRIGILQKFNVVITRFVRATPFQDAKPMMMKRGADTFYVRIGEEPLLEFRNMKKLIQLLPDHQQEMEEYSKKEKISANDPEELVKFSQYYTSLH